MKQSTSAALVIALAEKAKHDLSEFAIPGARGKQGARGEKGFDGKIGPQGETGKTGLPGSTGKAGPKGDQGPQGDIGPKGDTGDQGPQGDIGPKGDTGERGDRGLIGPRGNTGPIGPKGDIGKAGPKGDQGPQGVSGKVGAPGKIGPKGDTGSIGQQGKPGKIGPKGPKGAIGKVGPKGPKGDKGDPGKTYSPEEIQAILDTKLEPQYETMNKWRDNVNKSLASLGGGGSYSIRDMSDVAFTHKGDLSDNDMFVWKEDIQKFVTLNITDVINSIRTELEVQYDRLVYETTDSDVAVSTITFVGEAAPGSMSDSAAWRVKRIRELVDGNTEILWANDTDAFDKVWDQKETYTYDV